MHLPDINVWLALTFDSHAHHPAAKTWFDGLPNRRKQGLHLAVHVGRAGAAGYLGPAIGRNETLGG